MAVTELPQQRAHQWRAIFAINIPLGGIGLVLAVWLLAGRSPDEAAQEPRRFDVLGLVLSIVTAYVTQQATHHAASLTVSVHSHQPSAAAQACLSSGPSGLAACFRNQAIEMGLNDAFTIVLIVSGVAV